MIRKSTVFVIGAGASKEVGLPMGTELKGKIASSVSIGYHSRQDAECGERSNSSCSPFPALRVWSQFRGQKEALNIKAKGEDAARSTATALLAVTATADRLTQDALAQTLAAIRDTLERINDRMDQEEMQREAKREAESMYLRRIVDETGSHSNK